MNVMFLTIENYSDFQSRSIYMDLINEFRAQGHYVTVISACERRDQKKEKPTICKSDKNGEIRKVYVDNVTRMSNYFLKGINLMKLLPSYKKVVRQAIKERNYSLVVYGSPPITVYGAVKNVKKKQGAITYLLLKDIWPYDCLFGGALSLKGVKKIAFNYLAVLARRLYKVSDYIGCMSPANVRFLLDNEPFLSDFNKVEICPNSITPIDIEFSTDEKMQIRLNYSIPTNKTIFVYGGSLGVPQGIDFALKAIKECSFMENVYFVFVGGGTEQQKIRNYIKENDLYNLKLLEQLPKNEYERLVGACDVGLVFLHHDCLAPNYPSRILGYMQASLPILCATDTYTDVGRMAEENGYGLWCESDSVDTFIKCIDALCVKEERERMGKRSKQYLLENYTSKCSYDIILNHFEGK